MSDPGWDLWSDSPTAPQISKYYYTSEKTILAGSFIGTFFYGILTMLFFQCMAALLNHVHRKVEGIKWWLVIYTMAMFSFATVYTAMNLDIQSKSFIDNRRGSGAYTGPLLYHRTVRGTTLGFVPNVMFNLNNWLADGLLIYRSYIIYSTNLWAIVLPCLLYLASLGMGIVMLYFQHQLTHDFSPVDSRFGIPYLSVSVSLNVLLTLMIVIRLVLHGTGSPAGIRGSFKAASTMLIESCALFAVCSLVVVAALVRAGSHNPEIYYPGIYVADIFFPILAEIQVIAPLLIIQRVANGSALRGHTVTTGHASSFDVRRQGEPTGSDGTPLGGYLKDLEVGDGKNPSELGVVVETTTDFHPDGKV